MGNEPSSEQLWNMFFFFPFAFTFLFGVLSHFVCLCCYIRSSACFCLLLSSDAPSQREVNSEHPINTNEQESPPQEGLSVPALKLLFSDSSSISNTVNWVWSFEFLRFPEEMFLWSGFGFKDNRVWFFFPWYFKQTKLKTCWGRCFSPSRGAALMWSIREKDNPVIAECEKRDEA